MDSYGHLICPERELIVLNCVDSTNNYAKQLAANGAHHGTVVIADHQTAGRGRMGRSFSSPKGMGLYCSVIYQPKLSADKLSLLTVYAAEATRRAILEVCSVDTGIKWINDLIYGGKKLCGILTELTFSSGQPNHAIIGIGINCNQLESDFPEDVRDMAISLRQILNHEIDRAELAAALLRQLDAAMEIPEQWLNDYRSHCITLGQDVQLVQNEQVRSAHADGMDDSGALLVTLSDGTRERIFSGEVSVRGLYGYV